jgi:outer membrane immunogenic protein
MKQWLVAGALIVAAAGQAWAADLPEPPPPPPPRMPAAYMPAVAPVYNWGGLYFGINGGYGFGKSEWTFPNAASTNNFNVSGWGGGATFGANLQADAFVFGVEGDFDAMGLKGNTTCVPANCQTQDTWLGTLRGRIGYAADRVLVYGTAGGAYGNIQANTAGTSFQSVNKAGWTAGAGIETAFTDHWTARIEYLFVDLQNGSFATVPPALAGTDTLKFDTSLIRVGVDYKFR